MQIAENLRICPVWHPPQAFDGHTIWITPGLAFGTGKHPSTALCLKRLATLKLTDTTVLDWGCGLRDFSCGRAQNWGFQGARRGYRPSRPSDKPRTRSPESCR